jgi:hypothetical protein
MDTIYVGFRDGDKWTNRFLKKGFSHCSILIPFENGWLEIEPTQKILYFDAVSDRQIAHFHKVVRVKIKDFQFSSFPIKFCTCVTIVEYMLGKNLHAFTPHRLYKKLVGKYRDYFNTEEII